MARNNDVLLVTVTYNNSNVAVVVITMTVIRIETLYWVSPSIFGGPFTNMLPCNAYNNTQDKWNLFPYTDRDWFREFKWLSPGMVEPELKFRLFFPLSGAHKGRS